jgi:hypothetical protein
MNSKTSNFRRAFGVALIPGTVILAGRGSTPTSRTTSSSEQSATTMPAPQATTTTNATPQQNSWMP